MKKDNVHPCRFGAARVKTRIRAFAAEIEGVRNGKDSESVHRMRVASRRLRSTLPLFSICFEPAQYSRWIKGLRRMSRALGSARDTDVQLEFLDQYLRGLPEGSPERDVAGRIRRYLRDNRSAEQEKILSALDRLEKKGVLQEISRAAGEAVREGRGKDSGSVSENTLAELASVAIREARDNLLMFGPSVHDPGDVAAHHALRIAAKKLRYTLEVFRSLFTDRLRPAIAGLKRLQELLGQIHDCDVWIQRMSDPHPPAGTGSVRGIPEAVSPLTGEEETGTRALLRNRMDARRELYARLVTEWDTAVAVSLEESLSHATGSLLAGQGPRTAGPAAAGSLGALGGVYPEGEGEGHAHRVTRLALRLFDDLKPLHRFGKKERRILTYAGLLHDIGWAYGQKNHHARSSRMILDDRTLPVTSRERVIIALIARYHRKQVPGQPGRLFSGLNPGGRKRVLALASFLRIADGLDYTRADHAASLSCTIAPEEVICTVTFDGDGSIERARALAKADLFERVFLRRFVIP